MQTLIVEEICQKRNVYVDRKIPNPQVWNFTWRIKGFEILQILDIKV